MFIKKYIFFVFVFLLAKNNIFAIVIDNDGICCFENKRDGSTLYFAVGFGTYPLKGQICSDALEKAISLGYNIIDTATFYDNFEAIGQVIKKHDRSKFYIISKIWPDSHTSVSLKKDLENTLKKLQISYLDCYLLHWPNSAVPIEETLLTMAELQKKELIKHIGLSNVTVNHLKRALQIGVKISCVQIEMNPYFYDQELIEFCKANSIQVQAWAPLGRGRVALDIYLSNLAKKYNKTASQIALRWVLQNGCVPLPGSKITAHIKENRNIFDFVLTDQEMIEINQKAKSGKRERVTLDMGLGFTDEFDFPYEKCWPQKAMQVFDLSQGVMSAESAALKNIRQLTFADMGFEKAGESYFSPDGTTIIFQAVPKGKKHYQIYTININQNLPRMVSTGKGACTCAYFRPDGKKIIFASSHSDPHINKEENLSAPGYNKDNSNYVWEFTPYMNIYEANPDGSALKALTTGAAYHAECAYSSDGQKIVFASNHDGNMNIYSMNSDGSDIKQITFSTKGYNGGPFFSPDGKQIIFRADYEKQHYLQIYCIDNNGNNLRQLTNNSAVNWAPFWHPNGQVIAYTTSLHGHRNYEIYLLNIKTGINYRLTYNTSFDGLPSFSKDGSKIVWTSKRGKDNSCQIFIADFVMPEVLQ